MPALDWFVREQKKNHLDDGVDLRSLALRSDRGPHDFWCEPNHVYITDISKKNDVIIKHDTSAAYHNKDYHDQIGGTVKTFLG